MIINSRSHGFAHAFLIIGLVVALIGALGFVFWQNFIYEEPAATKTETFAVEKKDDAPAYKRTTSAPLSWKQHKDDFYNMSFSYPPTWTVKRDSKGNPDKYNFEIGMGPYTQQYAALFGMSITESSLDEYVENEVKNYKNIGWTIISNKKLTIDGHEAREVRYTQPTGDKERMYFVMPGNMVWELPAVYESDQTDFSAKDSLILFESVKFK